MRQRFPLTFPTKELKPFRQGNLDGLCGLYAIINAVRIILYPTHKLHRLQVQRLFDRGIAVLSRTRRLPATISYGMYHHLLGRVCAAIALDIRELTGADLRVRNPLPGRSCGTRDLIRIVKRSVRAGRPVIVALMGRYNHWTVIVSHTPTRFMLFDSDDMRWILIRSIALEGDERATPYQIARGDVLELRLRRTRRR